ncbi:MAG: hydroxyisourate hydrolase [Candidatus Dormibacteraeota bacterium]|nr:hydroxyisourate hydrolase [Candidatus Dormibacteraeota bacterium]
MSRATISTHVLDLATGKPVPDIGVSLLGDGEDPVGEGRTGADGRIAQLVPDGIDPGTFRLVFELEEHFSGFEEPHMFDMVALDVLIKEPRHYHIPLLVSPFGLSTYRGS